MKCLAQLGVICEFGFQRHRLCHIAYLHIRAPNTTFYSVRLSTTKSYLGALLHIIVVAKSIKKLYMTKIQFVHWSGFTSYQSTYHSTYCLMLTKNYKNNQYRINHNQLPAPEKLYKCK